MHQYAPTNTQIQHGLKSNDYNIPAGGKYKKLSLIGFMCKNLLYMPQQVYSNRSQVKLR